MLKTTNVIDIDVTKGEMEIEVGISEKGNIFLSIADHHERYVQIEHTNKQRRELLKKLSKLDNNNITYWERKFDKRVKEVEETIKILESNIGDKIKKSTNTKEILLLKERIKAYQHLNDWLKGNRHKI